MAFSVQSADSSRPILRGRRARQLGISALVAGLLAPLAVLAPAAAAPTQDAAAPQTDYNGDGLADVMWYAPGTAPDSLWTSTGNGFSSKPLTINANYRPLPGDFNGDGRTDIFWYAPGAAPDSIWTSTGDGFTSRNLSVFATYEPIVGDFNGDGKADIFWYAPGAAPDSVWTSTGNGFTSVNRTVNGSYRPFAGDFNGDGRSDIFMYAPGKAADYVWTSTGSNFSSSQQYVDGDFVPSVGDFDNDGRSDIFWYAPGSDPDYVWTNSASGFSATGYSINGRYRVSVGDYNGDRRSDIFLYGPGAESDHLWSSTGNGFTQAAMSVNGVYQPVGSVAATAPKHNLRPVSPGASGADVRALQQRLLALNYWVPSVSGSYDSVTAQAVMAFQKYEGLGRDGVAGPATIARMQSASPAVAREGGNHVEVSIAKQTLTVVRDGRTYVLNTSTGAPGYDTPKGRFRVDREINGMRKAPLGNLWRPKYFNSGIAMHGSPSIPGYPASHGCTRLHDTVINHIWDAGLVPIGTPVWVY